MCSVLCRGCIFQRLCILYRTLRRYINTVLLLLLLLLLVNCKRHSLCSGPGDHVHSSERSPSWMESPHPGRRSARGPGRTWQGRRGERAGSRYDTPSTTTTSCHRRRRHRSSHVECQRHHTARTMPRATTSAVQPRHSVRMSESHSGTFQGLHLQR